MIRQALLLSAGRGERLRPLTDRLPKPLASDGRESLIDRHLRALAAAGVDRVVINLGWLGEQIVAHVGDGARFGVQVVYSPEGYPTLDTGGAIRRALGQLAAAPFWVVNADIWTDFDFSSRHRRWLDDCDAALGLIANPGYRDGGDFQLSAQQARNPTGEETMTFSGIALYRPAFFAAVADGRFSVVPMLREAAARGALAGFDLAARWFDVGTPERLAAVRAQVSAG